MNVSVSNAGNHLGAMEAADYGFQAMTYSKHRWWPEGRKKKKKKNLEKMKRTKKKKCTECRIFNQVSCLMRNIASPMTKLFSKTNFIFVSSTVIICSSTKTDQYLQSVIVILSKPMNVSLLNIHVRVIDIICCMWYMLFIIEDLAPQYQAISH